MRAPDLIFELRSKGYSIRAVGGYLDISPADNLPPELVQNIRQSKAAILAALQSEFIGLYGDPCRIYPDSDFHPAAILKLIERGRASLAKKTNGHAWLEPNNPSTTESLALLVGILGLQNTSGLIADAVHRLGYHAAAAAAMHLPPAATKAVLYGCFPTAETAPTLQ